MAVMTSAELHHLISSQQKPCVSIYLPTHRRGPEVEQDPIRLKNSLRKAERLLSDGGMRSLEVNRLLGPARKLLESSQFWRHQSDGLAIFLSSDEFRHYELPYHFDEVVVVTDRFHVKPLLPILTDEARFYVLAISQNQVRLLQGSAFSVSEMNLDGVASSLAETLDPDRNQSHLQFYTGTSSRGGGRRDAIFHGMGGGEEDHKKDIQKFFSQVDRGIAELLKDDPGPLVLAGVDYLLSLYREVSRYPHLVDTGIPGNPEDESAEDLHRQAWGMVEPRLKEARSKTWQRFNALRNSASRLADDDVTQVIPSAMNGRIDALFVADHVRQWGTIDSGRNEVVIHDKEQTGDYDLLDLAAVYTLSKGGVVYTMPDRQANGASVAAIYRY